MPFIDLALSRRLERAEGQACRAFADVRRRLDSASGATSIECAGAYAVIDGISSPVTQTFGLGLFEEATPAALDEIERFFADRGAKTHHELSPLAGVATADRLCRRGYRPIEMSSVLFRAVDAPGGDDRGTAATGNDRTPHAFRVRIFPVIVTLMRESLEPSLRRRDRERVQTPSCCVSQRSTDWRARSRR